jgi:hypothetical protein
LQTARADYHRIRFMDFWSRPDIGAGPLFFNQWYHEAQRSGLGAIKKVAGTLRDHLGGLLTYFRHQITNALSESFNSTIQYLKANARASATSSITESASSSFSEGWICNHANSRSAEFLVGFGLWVVGLLVRGKQPSHAAIGAYRRQPQGCAARIPLGCRSRAMNAGARGCDGVDVACRALSPPAPRRSFTG